MEITYIVVVTMFTMAAAEILKVFKLPTRFVPLTNLGAGIISAVVCLLAGVETNVLQAFVLCVMAAMGGGGVYDLLKSAKGD